jgi:hypothetical protein
MTRLFLRDRALDLLPQTAGEDDVGVLGGVVEEEVDRDVELQLVQAAGDEVVVGERAEFVITRYREWYGNLRTHFIRIITKAGVKPRPKPWHNLRSTRQTELAAKYPNHSVCARLGNSRRVAQEFYLQVTDVHFAAGASEATTNRRHSR